MKTVLNLLLMLMLHYYAGAQVPDTLTVPRDTAAVNTISLPVLSDTTQYNDTTIRNSATGKDTTVKKKVHSPRKATIRSAIIPGWGQVYNKKYWKVPIVYAAIGIPVYLFYDNKRWYDRSKYALSVVSNNLTEDSASMSLVHAQLLTLVNLKEEGSLINYRNEFRRNMDYSVLFAVLMWGLNIADATVDGHLKGFNVSDDLSMRIRPVLMSGSMNPGIAVVLNFK